MNTNNENTDCIQSAGTKREHRNMWLTNKRVLHCATSLALTAYLSNTTNSLIRLSLTKSRYWLHPSSLCLQSHSFRYRFAISLFHCIKCAVFHGPVLSAEQDIGGSGNENGDVGVIAAMFRSRSISRLFLSTLPIPLYTAGATNTVPIRPPVSV